jgi:hypothetical protein
MSSGAWFAWFMVLTVVAHSLGEYFIHRLRKEAPEDHKWAGSPQGGSLTMRSPPHLGYVSYILSRRYVQTLGDHASLRRLADILFCLHIFQIAALVAWIFADGV